MIEERYLQTSKGKIAYLSSGNQKRTVVFLHGIAGWPILVHEMASGFNSANLRFVAPYLPGHGDSFAMPKGFGFTDMAETVSEFLDKISEEKVLVVGHSLGASLGLKLLTLQKANVAGVVLVDCYMGRDYKKFTDFFKFFTAWFKNRLYDFRSYHLYRRETDPKLVNTRFRWNEFLAYMELAKSISVDPTKLLNKIPVKVLWGKGDTMTPFTECEPIFKYLRLAGVTKYPGEHYWIARDPTALIDETVAFAEQLKLI